MTRISIAMATYNGERHIRQQLDSFARQTLPPYELVVTDDGSIDATLCIVEDFAASVPFPVRVYRNDERMNFAETFLRAASLCKGDWIAFSDQDDIWLDHKLAVISERIRHKTDVSLFIHAVSFIDEEAQSLGFTRPPRPSDGPILPYVTFESHLGNSMVINAGMIGLAQRMKKPLSTEYLHKFIGHDTLLLMFTTALGKVEKLSDVLVFYRQHRSQVTRDIPTHRGSNRIGPFGTIGELRTSYKRDTLQAFARFSEWADILEHFSNETPEFAERARAASRFYRQQARIYRVRAKCYDPVRIIRLGAVAKLLLTGRYFFGKPRGGLGLAGLAADVTKLFLG